MNKETTEEQQHHSAQRTARMAALDKLRQELKFRRITYAQIASGKSVGWVGIVLRGGYPFSGSGCLTAEIRRALLAAGVPLAACLREPHTPYPLATGEAVAG